MAPINEVTPDSGIDARPPLDLTIVAILFFLGGLSSAIRCLAELDLGDIRVDYGVLGLFIGPGLYRWNRGWRTCALVILWIPLVALPIVTLFAFSDRLSVATFTTFGKTFQTASVMTTVAVNLALFALTIWSYRVLTRTDMRRRFGLS